MEQNKPKYTPDEFAKINEDIGKKHKENLLKMSQSSDPFIAGLAKVFLFEKEFNEKFSEKLTTAVYSAFETVDKIKNSELVGKAKDFIIKAKEAIGLGQNNQKGL